MITDLNRETTSGSTREGEMYASCPSEMQAIWLSTKNRWGGVRYAMWPECWKSLRSP